MIINVGSAMAFRSVPLQAPYCGAKHAVKGFTEAVMCELAHEKSRVRLCMVQLPGVNTPQSNWNLSRVPEHPMPVPPVFQPEVPARAIALPGGAPAPGYVGGGLHGLHHPRRADGAEADRPLPGPYRGQVPADRQGPAPAGANLFEPRDQAADAGARCPFDDQAHGEDPLRWLSLCWRAVLAAAATAGAVAFLRRAS